MDEALQNDSISSSHITSILQNLLIPAKIFDSYARPKVYRFVSELIFRLVLGRDEKYLDRTDSGQSVIQEIIQRDRSETIDEETEVESNDTPENPVNNVKQITPQYQEQIASPEIETLIESHHSVCLLL